MSKQTKKQHANDTVVENTAETVESAVNSEVEQAESSSQHFTKEVEIEESESRVESEPVEKEVKVV